MDGGWEGNEQASCDGREFSLWSVPYPGLESSINVDPLRLWNPEGKNFSQHGALLLSCSQGTYISSSLSLQHGLWEEDRSFLPPPCPSFTSAPSLPSPSSPALELSPYLVPFESPDLRQIVSLATYLFPSVYIAQRRRAELAELALSYRLFKRSVLEAKAVLFKRKIEFTLASAYIRSEFEDAK